MSMSAWFEALTPFGPVFVAVFSFFVGVSVVRVIFGVLTGR